MRAGSLDRRIEIGLPVNAGNSGEPWVPGAPAWQSLAFVRAQLVQGSTEEFIRAFGEEHQGAAVFRIRYLAGVTLTHRVRYDGRTFDLKEIKEIGRRRGLELRCEETAS